MKHARNAVASVVALVLVVVLSFGWATSSPEPVAAQDTGCIVQLEGTLGLVICGGEIVQQLQLPTVKVTQTVLEQIVKEIRVAGPTIRIVGPTETITVRVPQGTTVPTETITVPGETKTLRPSQAPTVTETTTVTPSPTGQAVPSDDKVEPDNNNSSPIDFGDGDTTVVEVGLGALGIVAFMVLLLLAMYGGYALGWKNKERDETLFMAGLLDRARMRREKTK